MESRTEMFITNVLEPDAMRQTGLDLSLDNLLDHLDDTMVEAERLKSRFTRVATSTESPEIVGRLRQLEQGPAVVLREGRIIKEAAERLLQAVRQFERSRDEVVADVRAIDKPDPDA